MPNPLPEFEHPPINEVVLGLQFAPLKELQSAKLGLFWQRVRDRYPQTLDQPPIIHIVESPIVTPQPGQQPVTISDASGPRCWFLREDDCEMIQVQPDRFLRNWRQVKGDEVYPRFPALLERFQQDWASFLAFLDNEHVGEVAIDQAELTYINYIQMPGERDFSNLPSVFPSLGARPEGKFLPPPEFVNWAIRYQLPEGRGRLHVKMSPAFRASDMKMVLILDLTARGSPAGNTLGDVTDWLKLAHEWIVRGFDELTGPKMHEAWRKKT
jgi:uncharacterized protein (TIGR04255 family)